MSSHNLAADKARDLFNPDSLVV